MHASTGYCEIFTDKEGTATAPYVCKPRTRGDGGIGSEYLPDDARGCLSEGVYDIAGNRCCVPHLELMMDLMLVRWGHCDVRFIGE